jgi:predicted O-methyltransferase YrrM
MAAPMLCEWKPVRLNGVQFSTSVTGREAARLGQLAADKRVLEFGAGYGYSACMMAGVAERVVSVDHHQWIRDGLETMKRNIEVLGLEHKIEILQTDSLSAALQLTVRAERFGLVFIDGDHAHDAVLQDYAAAAVLIPEGGGIIACHDYGEDTCPSVKAALDQITESDELVDTLWIKHVWGRADA